MQRGEFVAQDGPSAGVTIATSLVSLLTGRLVRTDLVGGSCSFVVHFESELLFCQSDNPHSMQAMTGEISLHGLVLPVGGVRDKVEDPAKNDWPTSPYLFQQISLQTELPFQVLGAHRAGLTTVILPAANTRDLQSLPDNVKDAITFIPVS